MALNKVIMVGRLTQDPELKQTNTGVEVTRFGIAIQMATNKTEFFDVVAWRKTAGFIARFFRKGDGICIDGYLSTRTYEKDGVAHKVYEVICDSAGFAEGRGSAGAVQNTPPKAPQNEPAQFDESAIDGNLPF